MFELNANTKVEDMLDQCRKAGAGSMKVVIRNDKDEPTCAFIAIVGVRETQEILSAVEPVENAWANDGRST
jgi:hypothetical protein